MKYAQYSNPMKQRCRTFIPMNHPYLSQCSMRGMWSGALMAEAVRWPMDNGIEYGDCSLALDGCARMKTILGEIRKPVSDKRVFANLPLLENISIHACGGLDFGKSPNLSAKSVRFMASHKCAGEEQAQITVHSEVFSRLTSGTDEEWAGIVDAAAANGVVFVSK